MIFPTVYEQLSAFGEKSRISNSLASIETEPESSTSSLFPHLSPCYSPERQFFS